MNKEEALYLLREWYSLRKRHSESIGSEADYYQLKCIEDEILFYMIKEEKENE